MGESALKRTPLFFAHQKLNARLIDFGGWEIQSDTRNEDEFDEDCFLKNQR